MNEYNFKVIEQKWKQYWQTNNSYVVSNNSTKPKCYVLDMFPYPSGAGLHVGHPLGYIASDIYARYKRLQGFNVLHPMGFDSFGLPAEQYAIETGQHPAVTTEKNIARYKEQLNNISLGFDWSREVQTSNPNYYKWTQWIFGQLFNSWYNTATNKAEPIATLIPLLENGKLFDGDYKNLSLAEQQKVLMQYRIAFQTESFVNWCPALGTVLANDEVINGVSERGGHPVERKKMTQWFLRITAFAERLLNGLDTLAYPESLKEMQRNWIGKSEGAMVDFAIENSTETIKVFTTRPDTIFGVSFMVLAPEHDLVASLTSQEQASEVEKYLSYAKARSEKERQAEVKTVTGCFTGGYVIHPFTGGKIPVYISEYVLAGYGTGAIMAVPCGDERDYRFAKHFNINIPNIFKNVDITEQACTDKNVLLTASDFLNELSAKEGITAAIKAIETKGIGTKKINYRLRDAGFSRQRYWGEPFPIEYKNNGLINISETLPVELPHLSQYGNGINGKGPLSTLEAWMQAEGFTREADTMPGYAGSSWYFLRYMDPTNNTVFADKQATDYWNQVDVYVGGAEHAVGHLLYSRMWTKALHDLGFISFDEPFKKVINQGMIGGNSRLVYRQKGTNHFVSKGLIADKQVDELHVDVNIVDGVELDIEAFKNWRADYANATFELENEKYICGEALEKMSKRYYNVVNPDDVIENYGADTFRMYEMFLGPIEMSKPWDTKGIEGVHRFLRKAYRLFIDENGINKIVDEEPTPEELKTIHKHIKKIEHDVEAFAMNTAISQFMIATNELSTLKCNKKAVLELFTITLAPFAPHIAEEFYSLLGNNTSVLDATYPKYNEQYLVENTHTYGVAINGKTRTELSFALDADANEVQTIVLANEIVMKWMEDKPLKKFIYIPKKTINVVV
jgi:leucyl-tRNA synthetase